SGSLPARALRRAPALRVHSVCRRASELHRRGDGYDGAQAGGCADRAALRARARARPAHRDGRGHDDASALRDQNDADPHRTWYALGCGRPRGRRSRDGDGAVMSTARRNANRAQYDDAAGRLPDLNVLNYGFASDSAATVVPADAPERYCLQLYEHVVRGAQLAGANVLEVSCGRGGGAAFLARAFNPRHYVGVDLSEGNVALARERHAAPNLEFRVGVAE